MARIGRYESPKNIKKFFERINSSGIKYALIKNISNELPDQLEISKDIDILVDVDQREDFHKVMRTISRQVHHPFNIQTGWENLYGLPEFEMWRLFKGVDLRVDVTYMLCCRSIMPGKWIPLDQKIQTYAWDHRWYDEKKQWWVLDKNSQFIYLITRCVFDKRTFSDRYKEEIDLLKRDVDWDIVSDLFKGVFFKYTKSVIYMIQQGRYDKIINDHIAFKDY